MLPNSTIFAYCRARVRLESGNLHWGSNDGADAVAILEGDSEGFEADEA